MSGGSSSAALLASCARAALAFTSRVAADLGARPPCSAAERQAAAEVVGVWEGALDGAAGGAAWPGASVAAHRFQCQPEAFLGVIRCVTMAERAHGAAWQRRKG